MQIKKHIPNAITLLNLSTGLLAIIAIFRGYFANSSDIDHPIPI
ncbi:hypothetical protein SAMN05444337_0359 [Flavobacterium haoranii]|uniref:Uncharacterized protein n=1 Tax=Flavobacterium haoranii TaxID=683124 RepID=A0A1M6CF86_9FLAO|nr:hypothetical protein SAMN05444337_0359 [Flavobacterium haoranii]